LGIDGGLLTL